MIICDRCGKRITSEPHTLNYGELKNPKTEEKRDLCDDCDKDWQKAWMKEFGISRVKKNPENTKAIIELVMKFLNVKEKVMFT
jgi:hypothetical protein